MQGKQHAGKATCRESNMQGKKHAGKATCRESNMPGKHEIKQYIKQPY
jgi:hypothetical protein